MKELQLTKSIVFLDLETTGINISTDRIVEISVIKFNPNDTEVEKTVRVNPTKPIPKAASAIHGITDKDVVNEPTFDRFAKSFLDFINGCDIGGFNVLRFDIPLLQEEFKRCNLTWDLTNISLVDPMIIFHKKEPRHLNKEPRDLNAAYQKYCGMPLEGAHQAGTDARASKDILVEQVRYYSDIGETIEELHSFCTSRNPDWLDDRGQLINTNDGPTLGFGKYSGHLISEVAKNDQGYLDWILGTDFDPLVKELIKKIMEDVSS